MGTPFTSPDYSHFAHTSDDMLRSFRYVFMYVRVRSLHYFRANNVTLSDEDSCMFVRACFIVPSAMNENILIGDSGPERRLFRVRVRTAIAPN